MKLEYYLPENVIDNCKLGEEFDGWDYAQFESKVGIKQRHIASENETALDLAEKAALKLLKSIDVDSIDYILLCTQSPDYFLPTSACILQSRLGLSKNCGALDFNLGCSGYVYGLSLAKGLLASKIASNILLVTAETYSKHLHPKDRSNRFIFGDAATATLINQDSLSIMNFVLGSDGHGAEELIVRNGGLRNRMLQNTVEYEYGSGNITSDNHLYMNGPEIFNFTIKTIPTVVKETLTKNKMSIEDVDFFIFHQANEFMLNYLRKKCKIPEEKFCVDFKNTGNTVSSTIPIALKNSMESKKISKGSKVMIVGFGVGLSWAATIITLN